MPDEHAGHAGHGMPGKSGPRTQRTMERAHGGGGHHAGMEEEFRRRFYVTAFLTIPVLVLSPLIQQFFGYTLTFPGREYVLWGLATVIAVWARGRFIAAPPRRCPPAPST